MPARQITLITLLSVASILGCAQTSEPCGSGGTFVERDGEEYCVYSSRLAIVIEGGFECPAAMRFELDLPAHRVCSASAFPGREPPIALCAAMPEACVEMSPPELDPDPLVALDPPDASSVANDEPWTPTTWDECFPDALDQAVTGDLCGSPNALGCATSSRCSAKAAMCDPDGTVQASLLSILDCDEGAAEPEPAAREPWRAANCETALTEGKTFEACAEQFACARRDEDPCCLEYAICNTQGPLPKNVLVRYRFCELGCANIVSDEVSVPVTDCSAFGGDQNREELRLADLPCEGDFVCWTDHDLGSGEGTYVDLDQGGLRWCSEGIVRGQHSTIANVFIPPP